MEGRHNRESMLLASPLSISEPQLLNMKSSYTTDPLPNGHKISLEVPKHDERRNSDGNLSRLPDKRKIGHRRVDEEGNITYKKVPSDKLMQSIQEGIRHSVSKLASEPERDVLFTDFENTEIVFHPEAGTKFTPAHNLGDFHFKTYSPIAFRHFREAFQISPEDYMVSICMEELISLSNPGASGSLFYLTEDEMFILKTVEHSEAEFLLKLLPQYYMNIVQNPRTLLPKFFGLYCYKAFGKNVRIIVMDNILPRRIKYHHKFDLKGSTYKRYASDEEKKKTTPTLKDVDFAENYPEGIFLANETYFQLMSLFKRDCLVLQSFKIMDYSLLLGIYNLDKDMQEETKNPNEPDSPQDDQLANRLGRTRSINRDRLAALPRLVDSSPEDAGGVRSMIMRQPSTQSETNDDIFRLLAQANIDPDLIGGSIIGRTVKGERLLIFMGIIDILQYWRLRKKLEHAFKSIIHDGNTISVCHPTFYAKRYQEFMAEKVFHPQQDPAKFRLADIPLRLSGRVAGALAGSVSTLQKRESLSRSTLPPVVQPVTFMKTTKSRSANNPNPLQPDIVASTAGATDASSSAGVPSRPVSRTTSPLGHQKVKLSGSLTRHGVTRGSLTTWSHQEPIASEEIIITVADLQDDIPGDDVRNRSGSSMSSASMARRKLLEASLGRSLLADVPKTGNDSRFEDGDLFVVTQISEATQTANASINVTEADYEETDL